MVKTCPPNQENCDKILSKLSSIENRLNLIENETPSSQILDEPNISLNTRLGLIWSKLSDPKSSGTTFAFLNWDYKNAFGFFLLLQKARSQRFEVYIVFY